MVLVKLLSQQFKSLRSVHKGLVRRYEGLFPILGKVGTMSYKVELPPRLKIHPVFHVSYLKPYHEDKDDPSQGEASWEPADALWQFQEPIDRFRAQRGRLRLRWGRVSHDVSNKSPHGFI
ncbi:hypothetical protein AAG906_028134 [Vitis piasezkii]